MIERCTIYNGEVELIFDSVKHTYTVNNDFVPGVTSVIGVINKPALMYWAVNQAIERLEQEWQPGRSYDEVEIKKMLASAKSAHRVRKEEAGDVGKMIHQWIEQWIKGQKPAVPVNEVMFNATTQFLRWVRENDVSFVESERKIYSRKYQYAGTCDFVADINGKRIVGDIKTSSGVYPEMFIQTAAYQQALTEEFPSFEFDRNVIIRCGKDGTFEIGETTEFRENLSAFLGALAIHNRQEELKTREKRNGK